MDVKSGKFALIRSCPQSLSALRGRDPLLIHDSHLEGVKNAVVEFLGKRKAMSFNSVCSQTALVRYAPVE
jgi:hypothetical protein